MICPRCSSENIGVLDSRNKKQNNAAYKYRRRACRDCEYLFSTYEVAQIECKETTIKISSSRSITIETTECSIYNQTAIDILEIIKKEYDLE